MTEEPVASPKSTKRKKIWPKIAIILGVLVGIVALIYVWLFTTSPTAVRLPRLEHAHVRLQVLVDGVPVNFADHQFQTHYAQACTDAIASEPIHFHDNKDQFMHLHWKGITGGLVLKNYGWNMVGGADDTLGYRFDQLPLPQRVPTHGNNLPALPAHAALWVYTGDETDHRERTTSDFIYQDLETFLGKASTVNAQAWLDQLLFKKAVAHEGEAHDQAELAQINNLLGNIVVFVQKDKPSGAAVTERFTKMEPLAESTCGG
jgi:hypothetical protein